MVPESTRSPFPFLSSLGLHLGLAILALYAVSTGNGLMPIEVEFLSKSGAANSAGPALTEASLVSPAKLAQAKSKTATKPNATKAPRVYYNNPSSEVATDEVTEDIFDLSTGDLKEKPKANTKTAIHIKKTLDLDPFADSQQQAVTVAGKNPKSFPEKGQSVNTKRNLPSAQPPLLVDESMSKDPEESPFLSSDEMEAQASQSNKPIARKAKPNSVFAQADLDDLDFKEVPNEAFADDPELDNPAPRFYSAPAVPAPKEKAFLPAKPNPVSQSNSNTRPSGLRYSSNSAFGGSQLGNAPNGASMGGTGSAFGSPGFIRVEDLRAMPGNRLPRYDTEERLHGHQGLVVIHARVLKSGKLAQVQLARSSGFENLDQKTLNAVRDWKFYPGTEAMVEIPMEWTLSGGAEAAPSRLRH